MRCLESMPSNHVLSEARYIQCVAVLAAMWELAINAHDALKKKYILYHTIAQMQTGAHSIVFSILRVVDDWPARLIIFIT